MSRQEERTLFPDSSVYEERRAAEKIDPTGYKIVSVRLREAEYEAFSKEVASLGLTNNFVLRVAARRIAGFLEIDGDVRRTLHDAVCKIGELSKNISELGSDYRKSGKVDMADFAGQRTAFGKEFARLDSQLSQILNVSNRRSDGRFRLMTALDDQMGEDARGRN